MKKEKTIKLMGESHEFTKHFPRVVCINPTGLSAHCMSSPYGKKDVEFNQEVYDLHILKSKSVVFKLKPDDEKYYVSPFTACFAPITEENRNELKKKLNLISELQEQMESCIKKRNSILKGIKDCSN